MDRRNFISDVGRLFVLGSLNPGIPVHGRPDSGPSAGFGRVVRVVDRAVTDHSRINASVVEAMLDHAVRAFWNSDDTVTAWRAFFPGLRLSTDVIGIKVNAINQYLPTHPEVVWAVARALGRMGVPPNHILIWDRGNNDLDRCGYPINEGPDGILCYGTGRPGIVDYDPQPFSVHDETCYLSRILTEQTDFLVNISCLKASGAEGAGVTLCLKNLYGSFSLDPNSYSGPGNGKFHDNHCDPYIPAMNTIPLIRSKQVLAICDALFGNHVNNLDPPTFTYNGLVLGTDLVAVDRTAAQILAENGCTYVENATHIHTASLEPYSLGISDPALIERIDLINPVTGIPDRDSPSRNDTTDFQLLPNHPDPFNYGTSILFRLPMEDSVRIDVLNSQGQAVKTLMHRLLGKGEHRVFWDGSDQSGQQVPSGGYFVRLKSGSGISVERMMKVR